MRIACIALAVVCFAGARPASPEKDRARARDLGLKVGILPTGTLNAITDVAGVLVGHKTIIQGENVRTGVTIVRMREIISRRSGSRSRRNVGNLMGSTQGKSYVKLKRRSFLLHLSVPRSADFCLDYAGAAGERRGPFH